MPNVQYILSVDATGAVVQIRKFRSELAATGPAASKSGAQASSAFDRLHATISKAKSAIIGFIAAVAFAAVIRSITAVVSAAIDLERSFTLLRKTVQFDVGDQDAQFNKLTESLKNMSREIPVAADELARVAEVAGRLGVPIANLEKFTLTAIKLGIATELSAEQAATSLAQLINIMGGSIDNIDRLGSSLAQLEDTTPTTAAVIANLSLRFGAAAKVAGFTEQEVLGLSAAIGGLGIPAERGGTAIQKLINAMTKAVATGGKELETFQGVVGGFFEGIDFAELFRENPADAVAMFFDAFGALGDGDKFKVLEAVGLQAERVTATILSAGGAFGFVADRIRESREEFERNLKLNREAELLFGDLRGRLDQLRNVWGLFAADISSVVLPPLLLLAEAITKMVDLFLDLPRPVRVAIEALVLLTGTVVGLRIAWVAMSKWMAVGTFAGMLSNIKNLTTSLLGLKKAIPVGATVGRDPATGKFTKLPPPPTPLWEKFFGLFLGKKLFDAIKNSKLLTGALRLLTTNTGKFITKLIGFLPAALAMSRGLSLAVVESQGFSAAVNDNKAAFSRLISEIGRFIALGIPHLLSKIPALVAQIGRAVVFMVAEILRAIGEIPGLGDLMDFDAMAARVVRQTVDFNTWADSIASVNDRMEATATLSSESALAMDFQSRAIQRMVNNITTVEQGRNVFATLQNSGMDAGEALEIVRERLEALGLSFVDLGEDIETGGVDPLTEFRSVLQSFRDRQRPLEKLVEDFENINAAARALEQPEVALDEFVKLYADEILSAANAQVELGLGMSDLGTRITKMAADFVRARDGMALITFTPEEIAASKAAGDKLLDEVFGRRTTGSFLPLPGLPGPDIASPDDLNFPLPTNRLSLGADKLRREANESTDRMRQSINDIQELINAEPYYDDAEKIRRYGDAIRSAAAASEALNIPLDENTQRLAKMMDAIDENARRAEEWGRIWEDITAKMISDFSSAVTEILWMGGDLGDKLKGIFEEIGKRITQLFIEDLAGLAVGFLQSLDNGGSRTQGSNGMTGAMFGAGRSVFNKISGFFQKSPIPQDPTRPFASPDFVGPLQEPRLIVDPSPAATSAGQTAAAAASTAASAASTAASVSSSTSQTVAGFGSKLVGALNPISAALQGIESAINIGKQVHAQFGKGRKAADKFVEGLQQPFFGGEQAGLTDLLMAQFNRAKESGTLKLDQARDFHAKMTDIIDQFTVQSGQFVASAEHTGPARKVVEQATADLQKEFGKNFEKLFEPIDAAIADLMASGATISSAGGGAFGSAEDILLRILNVLEKMSGMSGTGSAVLTTNSSGAPGADAVSFNESVMHFRDSVAVFGRLIENQAASLTGPQEVIVRVDDNTNIQMDVQSGMDDKQLLGVLIEAMEVNKQQIATRLTEAVKRLFNTVGNG